VRETVLNSACISGSIPSIDEAAVLVSDVESGIAALIFAGYALSQMRLHVSVSEIGLAVGTTLYDTLIHLVKTTSDKGRLVLSMATKFPVEEDLEDDAFAALVEWRLPQHPDCLPLLLCACSGRLAVSLTNDPTWQIDPLPLELVKDPTQPGIVEIVNVDNIYSQAGTKALIERLKGNEFNAITPSDLWGKRNVYFPHLDFAPRVHKDLTNLGDYFTSAADRLMKIEKATALWAVTGGPSPTYLSKVTGESAATMNKYGSYRVFTSCDGHEAVFEKHARLPDGMRLHLRELPSSLRVEIGYIGPHLPIVSEG
jgi:hypothetical protein